MSEVLEGSVKWFDAKKGYGFITGADGKDVFVHFSEIQSSGFKTLEENDKVEYELGEGKQGPCALKVKKVV